MTASSSSASSTTNRKLPSELLPLVLSFKPRASLKSVMSALPPNHPLHQEKVVAARLILAEMDEILATVNRVKMTELSYEAWKEWNLLAKKVGGDPRWRSFLALLGRFYQVMGTGPDEHPVLKDMDMHVRSELVLFIIRVPGTFNRLGCIEISRIHSSSVIKEYRNWVDEILPDKSLTHALYKGLKADLIRVLTLADDFRDSQPGNDYEAMWQPGNDYEAMWDWEQQKRRMWDNYDQAASMQKVKEMVDALEVFVYEVDAMETVAEKMMGAVL